LCSHSPKLQKIDDLSLHGAEVTPVEVIEGGGTSFVRRKIVFFDRKRREALRGY
jgi:hypothetical protein